MVVQFEDSYQGMPFRHATHREKSRSNFPRRASGTEPASAAKAFRLAEATASLKRCPDTNHFVKLHHYRVFSILLDVLEPPVGAFGFQVSEPSAREIEQRDGQGQFHQTRHQDHAPANYPKDSRHFVVSEVEIEGPGDAKNCEFEEDEPGAADQKKTRCVGVFSGVEENAGASKEMKAGVQKCVIHLVKKIPGVGPPAGRPEYTRT